MPGYGNAHRIETDCGDAAKIIFDDKGLEMMAQALLYTAGPNARCSSSALAAPVAAKSEGETHVSGINQPERLTP